MQQKLKSQDKDPLARTDIMKSKGMLWKTVVSTMQIDCCGWPLAKWLLRHHLAIAACVISFLCYYKF